MPKAKSKTTFYCKDCGNETAKWEGRCPSCNEWNTIVEEKQFVILMLVILATTSLMFLKKGSEQQK